jgi:hypothetical protein
MPGSPRRLRVPRNHRFAGIFAWNRCHPLCLPCRRSWVRIPSAASEKACICTSFSCAQSASAFASTGSHWVAAASPAARGVRKRLVCRHLWALEPLTFCAFTWLATGSPTTARLHLAWPIGTSGNRSCSWLSDKTVRENAQRACGGAPKSCRARRSRNEPPECDGRDGRFGTHRYMRSSVLAWGFPDSHAHEQARWEHPVDTPARPPERASGGR